MASRHEDRKACVNQAALVDLTLFGPVNKLKQFFLQTSKTVTRLRLRTKGVQPFTKSMRGGVGNFPGLHEVIFWLDDIQKTEQYAEDIDFLKRVHVTLAARVAQMDSAV